MRKSTRESEAFLPDLGLGRREKGMIFTINALSIFLTIGSSCTDPFRTLDEERA